MLKRITKTTGLLLFAASIMPANAADVKKIDAQEGTIYSALAKANGIFIDGEIDGKDEATYYVSADGKYHEIDGLEIGSVATDFLLGKYVEIDQDTYVDITDNYKVLDETVRENLNDDAATTLRKKIKGDNDGRFDKNYYDGSNIIQATRKNVGDWATYQYKLKTQRINGDNYSRIYGDPQGNYVDADYNIGELKVSTTSDSVTIKNTEDTYVVTENGQDYELKAEIKENSYLNAGPDAVYRLVDLTIYKRQKNTTTWAIATGEVKFGGVRYSATNLRNDGSVTVFQKFSKTQASDDIDGIKYAKDSNLYFITDEDGKAENVYAFPGQAANRGCASAGATKLTVAGTNITSVYAEPASIVNHKIYGETIHLKSKNKYNYLDLSDSDDTEYDAWNPASGLPWILDGGYVKTWDGKDSFTKLYKVDGAMNKMSAFGKDNIIVWNEDDGGYSVIHNVSQATGTTTTTATGAAATTDNKTTNGWVKAADGIWSYNKADGTKATGWLQDGAWYYLNDKGVMATGWINDRGTWYYCNASGAMLSSTVVDGYVLGANGAWIK